MNKNKKPIDEENFVMAYLQYLGTPHDVIMRQFSIKTGLTVAEMEEILRRHKVDFE